MCAPPRLTRSSVAPRSGQRQAAWERRGHEGARAGVSWGGAVRALVCLALCLALNGRALAAESVTETICGFIDRSAQANHIPAAFLTRLIWSESSFQATAVSPA